jgi:hypothetical protein
MMEAHLDVSTFLLYTTYKLRATLREILLLPAVESVVESNREAANISQSTGHAYRLGTLNLTATSASPPLTRLNAILI